MATPKSTQKKTVPSASRYPPRPTAGPPEVVDPVWLLKAIALVIAAALVCGYATLCLLLYQGQWQLVLHPKRTTGAPAVPGAEVVRFGPDESAVPQLTGWMIAAVPGARYAGVTVLFLPPGDGSLADSAGTLEMLHGLGVTVFGIDYRGYGQSAAVHPSEERMMQDAESSLTYLTATRGMAQRAVVPFGAGLGASVAVHLAEAHGGIPAVMVDSPGPDPVETVRSDPRTKMLPVGLLLHERFPLAGPLAALKTPKLLLYAGSEPEAYRGAADPKRMVQVPLSGGFGAEGPFLQRFLDEYVGGR